jgi:hypothetical protein
MVEQLGLTNDRMPCQNTYRRVLGALDAQEVTQVLAAFFTRWESQPRCEDGPSRLLLQ